MHQASLSLSLSTATHVRQAQASWADILVWHSRLLEELQDAEFVQGATGQRYQVGFACLGAGQKDAQCPVPVSWKTQNVHGYTLWSRDCLTGQWVKFLLPF